MTSVTAAQRAAAGTRESTGKKIRLRLGLWVAVALVFAAQVAVLFWLGNPPPAASSAPPPAPIIYLGTNQWDELLALQDPTLFILPHRNNFSGAAWLVVSQHPFEPTNWSEPARPLELPAEQLGAAFATFMETSSPPEFHPRVGPQLDLMDLADLDLAPMHPILVATTVRVEGDLAARRLLTPVELPAQTNSDFDVLPDTEVQLLVDAQGNAFSPVIVAGGKNSITNTALNYARNVRFEPVKAAAPGTALADAMTFGKLIFKWQTVAPVATNTLSSR